MPIEITYAVSKAGHLCMSELNGLQSFTSWDSDGGEHMAGEPFVVVLHAEADA